MSPGKVNHIQAEASERMCVGPAPAVSGRGPSVWRGGSGRSRDTLDASSLGASHWEGGSRSHGALCVPEGRSPSSLGTPTAGLERLRRVRPPQIKVSAPRLCSSPPSRAHVTAGALTREAGGAPEPPSGFSRTVRPGGQTAFCLLPGLLPACAHVSHGESELLPRVRGSISGGLCFPSLQ